MTLRQKGEGCIYRPKDSRFWWIRYSSNGNRFWESTKTEKKTLAAKILQQRLRELNDGTFIEPQGRTIRLSVLAEELLRDYRNNERSSLSDVELRWKKHLYPFFGNRRAATFSTSLLNKYIDHRKQEGARNATINRELAACKRMFRLGLDQEPPMVARMPKFPKRLEENNVRQGYLCDPEYDELVVHCNKFWLRTFLAIAYNYGWRLREILNLRVKQVDFLGNIIRLEVGTTKNKEGREVAIVPEVFQLLVECCKGKNPDDYVLTRENGRPVRDLRGAWDELFARAGVGRRIPHDLRRSAVNNMDSVGISRADAMNVTGHKSESIYKRYSINNRQRVIETGKKLAQRRSLLTERSQLTPAEHSPKQLTPV